MNAKKENTATKVANATHVAGHYVDARGWLVKEEGKRIIPRKGQKGK